MVNEDAESPIHHLYIKVPDGSNRSQYPRTPFPFNGSTATCYGAKPNVDGSCIPASKSPFPCNSAARVSHIETKLRQLFFQLAAKHENIHVTPWMHALEEAIGEIHGLPAICSDDCKKRFAARLMTVMDQNDE